MPTKRILSVRFQNGAATYTLGCNSSDHMSSYSTQNTWYDSHDKPMGQVGCLIGCRTTGSSLNNTEQVYLAQELFDNGYGEGVWVLRSFQHYGVPFWLNGQQYDADGNPNPYIMFTGGGGLNDRAMPHYFRGDGTDLGTVFYDGFSGYNANFIAGVLYDDNTWGGESVNTGEMKPHYITPGVHSKKRYEWEWTTETTAEGFSTLHVVNPPVLDDIIDSMPITPEGTYQSSPAGNFDSTSDPIPVPGLPSVSPLDTGLTNMYMIAGTQLQSLNNLLWDINTGFVNTLLKLFQDPMEAILNLSICPIGLTGTTQDIIIGNFTFTGVQGQRLGSPYKQINFGSIWIDEFYGAYADYEPYTKLSIYLPYIGVQQISINDVMNGGVALYANVDVFTGAIEYFLFSQQTNNSGRGHQSVLYHWTGNCKYDIPISGSNFNRAMIGYLNNAVGSVVDIASAGVSGGNVSFNDVTGAVIPDSPIFHVQRGGGCGGAIGLLGVQYPYLIIERPELTLPDLYDHSVGRPSERTSYLRNYKGCFVKVRGPHVNITSATADEISAIENLLKDGVIV